MNIRATTGVMGRMNESIEIRNMVENPYPDASWSRVGTIVDKNAKWVYRKPIWDGYGIVDHLGAIKRRADGRWSWWRSESKHFPNWKSGQGVSLTRTGAINYIYEGLSKEETPSSLMADIHKYIKDGEVLGIVIDAHAGVFPWTRHYIRSEPTWKRGSGREMLLETALRRMTEGWI